MSEKETKVRFFAPDNLENHTSEGKGKEKKKERGGGREEKRKKKDRWPLGRWRSFWPKNKLFDGRGRFGSNVFKNPARDKEEFVITSNK